MTKGKTVTMSLELVESAIYYIARGPAGAERAIDELRALLAAPIVERQQCCTPTPQEKQLLASGDYTPEELWGGSRPTCPKCINATPPELAELQATIARLTAENERSEKHRNDLFDKITKQNTTIGALKAEIKRTSHEPILAVFPKRQSLKKSFECGGIAQEQFSMGWNACLDKVKELNQ